MKFVRLSALTTFGCILSLAVCAQAQTVTFVYQFTDAATADSMVQATDGNFYGTGSGGNFGEGQVFRMTPAGELTTIYSFCSQAKCADGNNPASLIFASDGNLYGFTDGGNVGKDTGTIFRMTLEGKITTLYNFCPARGCYDGLVPQGIVQAADENFYGVAQWGGKKNFGTTFRISPTGEFKLLHTFCEMTNCTDGLLPKFAPVQATDGNFYGTASGGANDAGVFYRLTLDGVYTVLYNFCAVVNCPDGYGPSGVVQGANGNFYGTTFADGSYGGGTIFEITSSGEERTLQSFRVNQGNIPTYGLTLANDGNFYGATEDDEFNGFGNLFEMTPAGSYTTLYSFGSQGYDPYSGPLVQGTNGEIYGTTLYSEVGDGGTIFSLDNGLSPLVETAPVAGPVGKSVLILGNGLTGSTSVTFNGVEAAFTVESDTYIKATVPTGATTGTVSVVTPSGTLNSNPQFVVTK
jgi:uncharacterized repeat protein (TIGR03803 family)